MKSKKYIEGKYIPLNPEKYKGDVDKIYFRSSWEKRVMQYFDNHQNIIWWSSEEIFIPYYNPIDKKTHRYFPDFLIRMKQKSGNLVTCMIEIKPFSQTQPPKQKRKTKNYINESIVYTINTAKWNAARIFCKEKGIEFRIITEKDLGI